MANQTSAARPYAIAAYEAAAEANTIDSWSTVLTASAQLVEQSIVRELFLNPNYQWDVLAEVCLDLLAKSGCAYSTEHANFVRLLAEADKLGLLTEIKKIFDYFKATLYETTDITVMSAESLTDDYKARLKAALKARFKHEVMLTFHQDSTLLAGILIKAGDHVIDGTVKTQLQRFTEALKVGT